MWLSVRTMGNELYNRKLRGTNVGMRVAFPRPIARNGFLRVVSGGRGVSR